MTGKRRTRFRLGVLLTLASLTASCRLTEVSLPRGSDVLIVEAVLRAGSRQQYVLLHRSVEDRTVRGEPGAAVYVTSAHRPSVTFSEANLRDCLTTPPEHWNIDDVTVEASCYVSPVSAGRFVVPGEEYELLVETERGERVRGRTVVPGRYRFRSPAVTVHPVTHTVNCALPTRPFTLVWSRAEGAWSYLASLHLSGWGEELSRMGIDVPDPIELTGVSVSAADTSLLFPANLGVFQRADYDQRLFQALQHGLPADIDATFVILAGDRNFTNGIRGGRFNPSGNIRTSSVIGDGVGVFGSVVPLMIRSTRTPNEPALYPCPIPEGAL